MKLEALMEYLDGLLQPAQFRDYCPNGLQVEGRPEVRRIVAGVTASQALLDAAIERKADAVLVHHGYFWKGEDGRITGLRRQRLAKLIQSDLSLIAYHLPLDAHPELGNNAQLAQLMGWLPDGRFGEQSIGWVGNLPVLDLGNWRLGDLASRLKDVLGRDPLVIGDRTQRVQRIAWCSGGAQGYFEEAIRCGVDVFVSGEISEQTVHLARESGVAYVSAGHHATERYGAKALASHLAQQFDLECEFVDIDNPV